MVYKVGDLVYVKPIPDNKSVSGFVSDMREMMGQVFPVKHAYDSGAVRLVHPRTGHTWGFVPAWITPATCDPYNL